MTLDRKQRRRLVDTLENRRTTIATRAMDQFLERHPGWLDAFGSQGRTRSEEDYAFHVQFLVGAVLATDPGAFADYVRWAKGVLASRGVPAEVLAESVIQVRDMVLEETDPDLQGYLTEIVDHGLAVLDEEPAPTQDSNGDSPVLGKEGRMYLQAIRSGDRRAALTVALEVLRAGASVQEVYGRILQPAQYEIGALWEKNHITVADEHLATAITQQVVARLYEHLDIPIPDKGNALMTGVEGELHQLGANMVADVLEADGWNMRFLGSQLPHRDILTAIDEHEPRLIGISATVLFSLKAVEDLIDHTRRRFGDEVKVVVGGGAFRSRPEIWRDLGADGYGSDLDEAVSVAGSLA